MIEIQTVIIGNKEYGILKEIKYKDLKYVYLLNIKDNQDLLYRKVTKDKPDLYIPLDDEDEVNLASMLLIRDNLNENN